MGSTTIVSTIFDVIPQRDSLNALRVRDQMAGLYNGAQVIGGASAVAPVVVGATQVIQQVLASRAAKKKT